MHSFYELRKVMGNGKFCLTTVDTIFREKEFKEYIRTWESAKSDGIMAVTDYIDDEKPLYVDTDNELNITAFRDTPSPDSKYISGGIYGLTPKALDILDCCMEDGIARMRNFQRRLVEAGMKLKAYPFSKIIDIDHAEDIKKAEEFFAE